ncbi:MAG: hypothetical protein JWP35_2177 [Caulobacter sp.]|nr:hypothetical protein [Caulobacter sp.]
MRYRSFGATGMAVSAVSLILNDARGRTRASEWRELVFAGLENGVNSFEISDPSPALLEGLGMVAAGVERRLMFVALRAGAKQTQGFSTEGLTAAIRGVLEKSGLGYLDLLTLDQPEPGAIDQGAMDLIKGLRTSRIAGRLGVAGDYDGVDGWVATGAFDTLVHPFSVASGWRERNRIKTATSRDMSVIASDSFNDELAEAAKGPKVPISSLWKRKSDPLSGYGTYAFLNATPGWTAEDICLAYSLTEPAVTTVLMNVERRERIEAMADVPERDLPTGVAAQIEMARFSAPPGGVERRKA